MRYYIKGTSKTVWISIIKNCICPAVLCEVVHILVWIKKEKFVNYGGDAQTVKIYIIIILVWTIAIIGLLEVFFQLSDYISAQINASTFIEEEYVNPLDIELEFPEQKRNLICIYVESAETTLQDKLNGGMFEDNYIPEMTEIAKKNISFSQTELIEGASIAPACGWTIAGLVAETSALPLKLSVYGSSMDNMMGYYETFLSGAVTLGDLLKEEGYTNYFMAGSDFEFGGRTAFFSQHGSYEIWDYYSAIEENKIDSDYYVWWGFEDQKLYSYAKEKIVDLANEQQPFNFSMLTVDTHQEDGYFCDLCSKNYEEQYANVWNCASKQLYEFLTWIEKQDFYENTTVVILGDHCSMDSDFFSELKYDKHTGEIDRKVYNAFINSAITAKNEKNRLFTTLDMFPTILASLGVSIEGNQLGLGVNLFSEKMTLAEKYGYDILFDELNKKSSYYEKTILYP